MFKFSRLSWFDQVFSSTLVFLSFYLLLVVFFLPLIFAELEKLAVVMINLYLPDNSGLMCIAVPIFPKSTESLEYYADRYNQRAARQKAMAYNVYYRYFYYDKSRDGATAADCRVQADALAVRAMGTGWARARILSTNQENVYLKYFSELLDQYLSLGFAEPQAALLSYLEVESWVEANWKKDN